MSVVGKQSSEPEGENQILEGLHLVWCGFVTIMKFVAGLALILAAGVALLGLILVPFGVAALGHPILGTLLGIVMLSAVVGMAVDHDH